jgi:hypothetical protein
MKILDYPVVKNYVVRIVNHAAALQQLIAIHKLFDANGRSVATIL